MNNDTKEGNFLTEFLSLSKKSFLAIGLFSLFINIMMLLPAVYMLAIYDIVVPSRSLSTLLFITLLVIFLFIIMAMLQIIRGKLLIRINNKIDAKFDRVIFDSLYKYSLKHPTRSSIQPFNDFQQIKQFLTGPTIIAFFDIPWVPIYIGTLFLFHPYYGILATSIVAVVIIITLLNEYTTKKDFNISNEKLIRSNKFLNDTLLNVEVIKAMGMQKGLYKKWFNIYKEHLEAMQKANDKNTELSNIIKNIRILSQSLMLGLGGYLALNLEISMGMIVAGSIVLGRALGPIDMVVNTWRSFSSTYISYRRLKKVLSETQEPELKKLRLPPPQGYISVVQAVVVPPDSKTPVIKRVTMHISAGEMVAIVGPSGAGKTSLVKAMLGIWKLYAGKVEIDGADLRQWDDIYLGQFIGYLPQDIELFEGTIAENIARFGVVNEEFVLKAAKIAGAHELITKFPDGYNTYIGPGGLTLSAGQRQRIALARALYGDPKIIVLDEPNSNLDDAGEQALFEALRYLKEQKTTVIIISHKRNILDLTDKIAVLKNGALAAFGDREQILAELLKN